ncbi:LysM peptidoglycan-binding domain-containing protein [Anaerolineae bacterium CFX9]|jgi:LysM repeat protein|nr:LysM peptidoglycan-binding domain-containing protein [Anaerolineae bacterium CFX9]
MRIRVLLALIVLVTAACNLTTNPPTPTAPPTEIRVVFPTSTPFFDPSVGTFVDVPSGANPNCPSPPGWVPYEVQNGDILGVLAEDVGIGLSELQSANCLTDANQIYAGQILFLPRLP